MYATNSILDFVFECQIPRGQSRLIDPQPEATKFLGTGLNPVNVIHNFNVSGPHNNSEWKDDLKYKNTAVKDLNACYCYKF